MSAVASGRRLARARMLDTFDQVYAGERPGFLDGYTKLKEAITPWQG